MLFLASVCLIFRLLLDVSNMEKENVTASSLGEVFGLNPDLFMYYVTQTLTYRTGMLMARYVPPCIFVIGLVGNILSLMVVTRNRKISCYIYLAVLAVTDSIALITTVIYWYLSMVHELLPYTTRLVACRCLSVVLAMSVMSSTYIIVTMTLDRLVAVKWPFKALHWCTAKKTKISCLMIVTICCLFKAPYIWVSEPYTDSNTCAAFRGEQTTLLVVYYWINTVVANYLPFCSLLVMNFLIIHSLRTRRTILSRLLEVLNAVLFKEHRIFPIPIPMETLKIPSTLQELTIRRASLDLINQVNPSRMQT